MKNKWRIILILLAVVSFGIALSYPIRYRLEAKNSDNTLEQLSALRNAARTAADVGEATPEVDPGARPPEATEAEADANEAPAAAEIGQSQARGPAAERNVSAPETGDASNEFSEANQTNDSTVVNVEAAGLDAPEAESKPVLDASDAKQAEESSIDSGSEANLQAIPGAEEAAQSEVAASSDAVTTEGAAQSAEIASQPDLAETLEYLTELLEGEEPEESPEDGLRPVITPIPFTMARQTPIPTPVPTPSPRPTASPTPAPTVDRFVRSGAMPYPDLEKKYLDESKILPEYREIYAMNSDFVGWITIPGMNVDYPVVQTEDSEFYLEHDFFGEKNANGQIILDTKCDPYTPSYNLVISGHNMRSGKMFGNLVNYMYKSFWEKHKLVEFDTLMERNMYVVLAAFFSADYDVDEEGFRYNADIQYAQDTKQWLNEIEENQVYDTEVDAQFGDKFLTLTTCNKSRRKDGRFVLVCRMVREGEVF